MASPLAPYINSRILVPVEGEIGIENGRFVTAGIDSILVRCFLSRQQYDGVSSGSRKLPLESQLDGRMLPGVSGDGFYYRGYAIEWVEVDSDWDLEGDDESNLTFSTMDEQYDWIVPGREVQFKFGNDPIMRAAQIERSSGRYGGTGIDTIIYREIGGVELQITGGEVQV